MKLVALFSPEHGIRGVLDEAVPSSTDEKTGLPIHSLYGDDAAADGRDARGPRRLVIDLQDIGARFYTYMTTMAYVMEEAAKRRSRWSCSTGRTRSAACRSKGPRSTTSAARLHRLLSRCRSARHDDGRAGEAVQRREEDRRGPDRRGDEELAPRRVVRRDGPAVGQSVAEHAQPERGGALSRHRRDRGDEHLGRPRHGHAVRADRRAVDGRPRLAAALNARRIPGVRFYPVRFTPTASRFANRRARASS